ncbi:hypothetical protein MFRU_003g04920 [Monilinia fructicola]|uniref:Uncharacterized protein n=1 Tax=Monilinia fructicola TaxID=38448 RepID=A0A5M9K039_MONFR|nr:hypothetical protein EYC84_002911 [Monilinia fructicola]KAG4034533.1 hypothetical protein MFRU_003g04920 [Monilinia fructicola]
MAVATSGNALLWTPDNSLHAGVYKIYRVPSENSQSEVDSPTFTLGNIPAGSSTHISSAGHSQIPPTSSIQSNPGTGTAPAPTTNTGTTLASSMLTNTQPETNQSTSLTITIKITIAICIILTITLIMLVAFILLRRQRYLATIPRTKRQLTTKEIADDGDSWCEEQHSESGLPTKSEAVARPLAYVDLRKKMRHRSVNAEPVELDTYVSVKDVETVNKTKVARRIETDMGSGLGLGLGDIEELVEPKELDSGTIAGERETGRKKFNVRSNVNIVGI